MSASQTVSGRSATKCRSSRFGATGRSWRLSVVRGGRRRPPRGGGALSRHSPAPAPPPGGPPPPRRRRGGPPPGAVGPPTGGEDVADQAAQLGLCFGPSPGGGD